MTVIEVFADIWCPFTHVGLRRIVAERERLGVEAPLRVRPWPLELVNGKPMDADFIGEEVDDLKAQVSSDLFAAFDSAQFPESTLGALALVESAYDLGVETGEAVSLALRDALFEQGLDVGRSCVLSQIASDFGVPPASESHAAAVRASWDDGVNRGVIGSPHFFTPAGGFFCPALDIERVDGHLRIRADIDAFEQFLQTAFS